LIENPVALITLSLMVGSLNLQAVKLQQNQNLKIFLLSLFAISYILLPDAPKCNLSSSMHCHKITGYIVDVGQYLDDKK